MCEGSKADPDFHIRSITTAIFRATATRAFDRPTFFESSSPQVCKALFDFVEQSRTVAADTRCVRVSLLPKRLILPTRERTPDWWMDGVRPK